MDVALKMGSLVFFSLWLLLNPLGFKFILIKFFWILQRNWITKNKDLKLLTIAFFFWTNEGFKGTLKNQ